jgi:hypothetical protein
MTPAQQEALETLADRALTADEVTQIDVLLPARNDFAIAEVLSVGRKRLRSMLVGPGTVVVAMDPHGGACLDAINALGETNRDVYWGMDPIRRGDFDLGLPSAQAWLDKLAALLPDFAEPLQVLQSLGYVADPFHFNDVSRVLNVAEGRMTL